MQRASTLDDYRLRIGRAVLHLEQHLDDGCTLEELAGVAAFSSFHFHRVFRAVTGEGVAEHRRRLRLDRAARRLRTTERTVVEIALEAGYETHESFTRAFEAAFGRAPSRYRAERGLLDHAAANLEPVHALVSEMGPLRLLAVRHVGPYDAVGTAFGRLAAWMGPRGLFGPVTRAVGLCYDDPEVTDPARLRYSAAFTVAGPVNTDGGIECVELPRGKYLRAVHRGPYERLSQTYAAMIRAWAEESELALADEPSVEFYRNTPAATPPERLETEICLRVDRA